MFHGNGIGLLCLVPLDRLPLEEAINRHDASALAIGFVEGRQLPHRLALSVDRLAPAGRVLAPVRDQPPAQRVKRDFPGLHCGG